MDYRDRIPPAVDQAGDLDVEAAALDEQARLWEDLDLALRADGHWSPRCDAIAARIARLTRALGRAPHWTQVPAYLLEAGLFQRMLDLLGVPYDLPDRDQAGQRRVDVVRATSPELDRAEALDVAAQLLQALARHDPDGGPLVAAVPVVSPWVRHLINDEVRASPASWSRRWVTRQGQAPRRRSSPGGVQRAASPRTRPAPARVRRRRVTPGGRGPARAGVAAPAGRRTPDWFPAAPCSSGCQGAAGSSRSGGPATP
ncbi:hypothetical protein F5972_08365 [Microbispora cellulosiformans]|uniref:Uncharacterized protein n=1 Tax=Microbispora cellulosiformans TaxID=2614688 RepID=A0A5J5K564_9ACTN|nr:hypothetical protein [Microbispora cellulosiformans]KAA9379656.1 hypothetical protein F5972_08365 [Microbispora cellulosiformans]